VKLEAFRFVDVCGGVHDGGCGGRHQHAHIHEWPNGRQVGGEGGGAMMLSNVDGTLSANGVPEWTNDASELLQADWDINNLAGTPDGVALLDEMIITGHQHCWPPGGKTSCGHQRRTPSSPLLWRAVSQRCRIRMGDNRGYLACS